MTAWWAWLLVGLAAWLMLACLTAAGWARWWDRIKPPALTPHHPHKEET